MTIKNPGSEAEANQPLTQELIDKLEKDPSGLVQLSEKQLRELVAEDNNRVEPERPVEKVAPAQEKPGNSTSSLPNNSGASVSEKKVVTADPAVVEGEKYRAVKDELNTKNQLLQNTEAELAKARALLERSEATKKALESFGKSIDPNSDTFVDDLVGLVKNLETQVKSLTETNAETIKIRTDELSKSQSNTETDRTFLQIEQFQLRSPDFGVDFKTSRPIRDIDRDMGRLEKIVGEENVKKMKTDENFRKEMESKGIVLPSEWEKHDQIMQLHNFKKANGYPSYTGAFVDFSEKSDFIRKRTRDVALEAANAVAEKIANSSKEASLLPASSGSGVGSHVVETGIWTKEKASKWMSDHPTPKTKEERETQWQILKWLETQPDD